MAQIPPCGMEHGVGWAWEPSSETDTCHGPAVADMLIFIFKDRLYTLAILHRETRYGDGSLGR